MSPTPWGTPSTEDMVEIIEVLAKALHHEPHPEVLWPEGSKPALCMVCEIRPKLEFALGSKAREWFFKGKYE